MNQENYSVLVDAKQEYNHQIVNILSSGILKGIKGLYYECENMCQQENTPENVLMVFQDKLSKVPKWSLAKIEQEFKMVKKESNCDWINDLLKVIYVTHIKILSLVNKVKKKGRLNIKVPTGPQFLHICYVNVAREMWKNPYLCSSHVSRYEQQKNTREMEIIIKDTIMNTLRQQLPVKNIIQDFLELSEKEDLSIIDIPVEHEDLDNPHSKTNVELKNTKYMDKLENIVKDDLKGKYLSQTKSKKIDRFNNLGPRKVKNILESSKVEEEPRIPLDNLEGDLNEIKLEELIVEDKPKVKEFNKEVTENKKGLEDALNPELNNVVINGDDIVKDILDTNNIKENDINNPNPIDDNNKIPNSLPPSYSEINTSIPLDTEEQNNSTSLDSLLTENEKDEISSSTNNIIKENTTTSINDELINNSSFNKPLNTTSTTGTLSKFQIDELDNIDLEVDELPNVDLQEISNTQREVQTTSILPKKKFTFFTDAPNL